MLRHRAEPGLGEAGESHQKTGELCAWQSPFRPFRVSSCGSGRLERVAVPG